MSTSMADARMQLPISLQKQLHDFRRRVWTIKSIEAACGALFGVLVAYLSIFTLDRFVETPVVLRFGIFLAAVGCCAVVPVFLHRWIWQHRRLEQLARLVSHRHPGMGDQMLGIIEIVRNEAEQIRSRALCEAAIHHVAEAAGNHDFTDAVPNPRHKIWAALAGAPTILAIILLVSVPAAALNAWSRFALPWKATPRYTFTALDPLPERWIVAHGEPTTTSVKLKDDSLWRPEHGTVQLGRQVPVTAELKDGLYAFSLPPQIDSHWMHLSIGDARQRVRVEPMLRPELSGATVDLGLPDYLERPEPVKKDLRGGSLTVVQGAVATITVTASRNLSQATLDGTAVIPRENLVASLPMRIDASRKIRIEWQDEFGLKGLDPFEIAITAQPDAAPVVTCDDLPRQQVVLDSETLTFHIRASDDFGVRHVGLEWNGLGTEEGSTPAQGERLLAAGGSEQESLPVTGTFCARTLEIAPQPLTVRLFVEDYLPNRGRVYSQPFIMFVLDPEQHAIWLTERLSKWHHQSLEVRDREMQLHHTNQELRMLPAEELDQPETRKRIEAQSAAERANGRRLSSLVVGGEDLVRQAMRNPEFGVGHLEKWAEMLQILKDISASRMPNVADLLRQSSQAPAMIADAATKSGPMAGMVRGNPGAQPVKSATGKPQPPVPQVVDSESSQQPPTPSDAAKEAGESKPSSPRLTLPVTTITGSGGSGKPSPPTPAGEKLEEAVRAQQDLLAEFDRIADELNKILANLEGSTLVKRLKAASRTQYTIAGRVADQLKDRFGQGSGDSGTALDALKVAGQLELKSSEDVSLIMDDLEAYFERRRLQRFKIVLDEMREQDTIDGLRQLSDDIPVETGLSMAQAEFWSDTFDRWADDLVDPASCGKCPGCKSKGSLPPSIVLEAMQILEAEINLREETRVAQQARKALDQDAYGQRAGKLSTTQDGLSDRVAGLTIRIRELPDGEQDFAREIALLNMVERVMDEATEILQQPETGSPAIAAETEAIELLLQSKRINPKGGGGGGSAPGGGGGGTTSDTAIALVGAGLNDKEVREDRGVSQTTGETGRALPEEFRAGLDEYFNRFERDSEKP